MRQRMLQKDEQRMFPRDCTHIVVAPMKDQANKIIAKFGVRFPIELSALSRTRSHDSYIGSMPKLFEWTRKGLLLQKKSFWFHVVALAHSQLPCQCKTELPEADNLMCKR